MKRIIILAALALCACALTPEQKQAHASQYCEARGETRRAWALQAPPANASVYRRTAAAGGYAAPAGDQEEFWFSAPDGYTRLCVIDPRPNYSVCSGGYWDFRESDSGPEYMGGGQWICAT